MILVDTSVWVDFFKNKKTAQVSKLVMCLEKGEELCLCGVILTEILQGIKNVREYHQIQCMMDALLFLEMTKETFLLSAEIYRKLRERGITIRKSIDCMIAAVAIQNQISLLHNDKDFDPIEKYLLLKVA